MVGTGTEVRHHDELRRVGLLGGVDRADRRVTVNGVRPFRAAPSGAGGPHHHVVAREGLSDLVGGQLLDVRYDGLGAGPPYVLGLLGLRMTPVTS